MSILQAAVDVFEVDILRYSLLLVLLALLFTIIIFAVRLKRHNNM